MKMSNTWNYNETGMSSHIAQMIIGNNPISLGFHKPYCTEKMQLNVSAPAKTFPNMPSTPSYMEYKA